MNRKISTLSTIAALLMGSGIALGHTALEGTIEIPGGNAGYLNSGGNAVRTALGDCLTSGTYSDDSIVNACAGIEEEVEVEAVEETAYAEAAPAPEPVKKEPIVTTATLGGEALFATGSSELSAASSGSLSKLVVQLGKFQEISAIDVVGHTDATGANANNQSLSEARAAAVEEYLSAAYPDTAISSSGMGEDSPVATNSTPEGRAQNRRVEIQVTAKSITE
jgi:OOP family OmpA-OmpF porin